MEIILWVLHRYRPASKLPPRSNTIIEPIPHPETKTLQTLLNTLETGCFAITVDSTLGAVIAACTPDELLFVLN